MEIVLNGEVVSRPAYSSMYWGPAQMLAHLTVNGASLRTGDLFGSGTISGAERDQRGSFLELSWGGQEPLAGGRTFLEDGDEVVLRYSAPATGGGRITLGEVTGTHRAGAGLSPRSGDSRPGITVRSSDAGRVAACVSPSWPTSSAPPPAG